MRTYNYVGPDRLADLGDSDIQRLEPTSSAELAAWLRAQSDSDFVTLTFVVTMEGRLRVSSRHSEHVACAQGHPVLAAGELNVIVQGDTVQVEGATNQSTGYCPEPDCFPAVADALERAGLNAPAAFAHEFVFRRCPGCGSITIVKDGDFECPSCLASLPENWNFAD